MADNSVPQVLWAEFVREHHVGTQEQDDFLAYLRRPGAAPVTTRQDLEEDYLDFLHETGARDDPS